MRASTTSLLILRLLSLFVLDSISHTCASIRILAITIAAGYTRCMQSIHLVRCFSLAQESCHQAGADMFDEDSSSSDLSHREAIVWPPKCGDKPRPAIFDSATPMAPRDPALLPCRNSNVVPTSTTSVIDVDVCNAGPRRKSARGGDYRTEVIISISDENGSCTPKAHTSNILQDECIRSFVFIVALDGDESCHVSPVIQH